MYYIVFGAFVSSHAHLILIYNSLFNSGCAHLTLLPLVVVPLVESSAAILISASPTLLDITRTSAATPSQTVQSVKPFLSQSNAVPSLAFTVISVRLMLPVRPTAVHRCPTEQSVLPFLSQSLVVHVFTVISVRLMLPVRPIAALLYPKGQHAPWILTPRRAEQNSAPMIMSASPKLLATRRISALVPALLYPREHRALWI